MSRVCIASKQFVVVRDIARRISLKSICNETEKLEELGDPTLSEDTDLGPHCKHSSFRGSRFSV